MIEIENKKLKNYTFIDLFAGIGGFHLALSSFGAKCVFASEWDSYAAEVYEKNYAIKPNGDITNIKEEDVPTHNILCAGFPCQAFSVSGKQKGFEDTRGTLFFDIARIAAYHRPEVLFLENVKNLAQHNDGKTLETILDTLQSLDYTVFFKVLNTSNYSLPQNRERVYIVAFHNSIDTFSFRFPTPINTPICLEDILEPQPKNVKIIKRDDIDIYKDYTSVSSLFSEDALLNKPIQIGKVNKGGQGERIYHPKGHAITLSAYGGGVGSKTGLYLVNQQIRKLTVRECARVQGFPDSFIIHQNESQAYKQFGNSVSVNVLQHILFEITKVLELNGKKNTQLTKRLEYA